MMPCNRMKTGFLACMALAFIAFAGATMAQSDPDAAGQNGGVSGVADTQGDQEALLDPNLYVGIQEAYEHTSALRTPEARPEEMQTLFFTLWQHKLMEEQRRIGVQTRRPGASELSGDDGAPRVKGIRELSLGGIVYASAANWVVWLNSQRVTPDAIPPQVIDIQVHKDYIELKWYDSYTNLVFPVRMRTHQRFNLDSRIFLPGAAAL